MSINPGELRDKSDLFKESKKIGAILFSITRESGSKLKVYMNEEEGFHFTDLALSSVTFFTKKANLRTFSEEEDFLLKKLERIYHRAKKLSKDINNLQFENNRDRALNNISFQYNNLVVLINEQEHEICDEVIQDKTLFNTLDDIREIVSHLYDDDSINSDCDDDIYDELQFESEEEDESSSDNSSVDSTNQKNPIGIRVDARLGALIR